MDELYRSNYGYTIQRNQDTLWIQFDNHRTIAGNSPLHGGIHQGIITIFNHTIPPVEKAQDLPGGNMENYLQKVAVLNGMNPQTSSGLLTSAAMHNCSVQYLGFRQLEVLSVVTAGVDINGGRAGDPAGYFEREEGQFYPVPGTINVLMAISANLPPEALLKSIITATEAKTAALQELMAPSQYSTGLATGSGTDGIIVAADPTAKLTLTDAGQHSKLGELIGRTTKAAIQEALGLETGLTATRQLNALTRLKRFGVNESYLRLKAQETGFLISDEKYTAALHKIAQNPAVVAVCASLLHLQDELNWGLLPRKQALEAAWSILNVNLTDYPMAKQIPDLSASSIIDLLVQWMNTIAIATANSTSN